MSTKQLVRSGHRRRRVVAGAGIAAVGALGALASRVPSSVLVPTLIVVLAGVDIAGAIAAKAWAHTPEMWIFLGGSALYVLLFWLYAQSLRHGELTTVTVGWVVVLTVASMLLDHFYYGVRFPLSKWVAAAAVVGLLGYLLTDSGGKTDAPSVKGGTEILDGSGTEMKTR